MICVKLTEESTQDRCLPGAHFSREGNESYAIVNAVQKVCKGFPMVLAQKDKPGVGSETKRLFAEAMKVEVHLELPLESPKEPLELSDYTDFRFITFIIGPMSLPVGRCTIIDFLVTRENGRGEEI